MTRKPATLFATILAVGALSACTNAAEADTESADTDSTATAPEASGLAAISVESISAVAGEEVDDQFISCIEDRGNGITTTQFYLIQNGVVKSYSQMQNQARPMCDAGQPGCALGWQGDKIALYFKTASGAVNQMLLDLDTMMLSKRLTTTSKGVEESSAQCTSGPYPEGVTID